MHWLTLGTIIGESEQLWRFKSSICTKILWLPDEKQRIHCNTVYRSFVELMRGRSCMYSMIWKVFEANSFEKCPTCISKVPRTAFNIARTSSCHFQKEKETKNNILDCCDALYSRYSIIFKGDFQIFQFVCALGLLCSSLREKSNISATLP